MKKRLNLILCMVFCMVICMVILCACHRKSQETIENKDINIVETASLKEGQLTTEDVKDLLGSLITDARIIHDIFNGYYLPLSSVSNAYMEGDSYTFVPVNGDSPFQNIAQVKAYTEQVFTKEMAEEFFYQYYLDEYYPCLKEINGKLCVSWIPEEDTYVYDWNIETAEIRYQLKDEMSVYLEFTSNRLLYEEETEIDNGQTTTGRINLKKQDGLWKIDNVITNCNMPDIYYWQEEITSQEALVKLSAIPMKELGLEGKLQDYILDFENELTILDKNKYYAINAYIIQEDKLQLKGKYYIPVDGSDYFEKEPITN